MSEDVLKVETRESRGTKNARRMRKNGKIPAILYGHGKESVALAVDAGAVNTLLRRNAHLVKLDGAGGESALFKDLQYDALGSELLHIDFTRVDADEVVTVSVEIHLRGVAPGTKAGGVVDHQMHEIEVDCAASSIPETIEVSINELELGDVLTAGDLKLPEKVKIHGPADAVVAACVEPSEEVDDEVAAADGAEPEIIGGKPGEGEGDDSE